MEPGSNCNLSETPGGPRLAKAERGFCQHPDGKADGEDGVVLHQVGGVLAGVERAAVEIATIIDMPEMGQRVSQFHQLLQVGYVLIGDHVPLPAAA